MFRHSRWSTSSFARWCCMVSPSGRSEGQISNAVSTIVSHAAEAKPRGWQSTASDSHPDGGRSAALPSCASSHGELLPPRCPRLSPSSPSSAPPPTLSTASASSPPSRPGVLLPPLLRATSFLRRCLNQAPCLQAARKPAPVSPSPPQPPGIPIHPASISQPFSIHSRFGPFRFMASSA